MNNSINCSGFVDMFLNSNDDYEPYGYSDADASFENAPNTAQLNSAGHNEYTDD